MGKIALPEMKRYNYDDTLATGTVDVGTGRGLYPSHSYEGLHGKRPNRNR